MGIFKPVAHSRRWRDVFHPAERNELVHVLEGQARIETKNGSFSVRAPDTFLLPQGCVHRDHSVPGEPYRVVYVFFDWPGGEPVLRQIGLGALCGASAGLKSQLHGMIRELEEEYLGDSPGDVERVQTALLGILLCMARHSRPRTPLPAKAVDLVAAERRRELARRIQEYLEANYARGVSPHELAEELGVSSFHLCRVFSQQFGMPMTEMLTLVRIDRAKEALRDASRSVKEVSAETGFADANYFAKVFRRYTGQSPSQYRLMSLKRGGRIRRVETDDE
jgi:AraC-like DNA-binding protein